MGDEGAEELSVANAYCVVYKLKEEKWTVTGEGWAQIHLYKDQHDGSHRIVGWTVLDYEVVINCNVNGKCKYKKKSEDFHKFTDEENIVYGFGFYKKEESVRESQKFMDTVLEVIQNDPQDDDEGDGKEVDDGGPSESEGGLTSSASSIPSDLRHKQQPAAPQSHSLSSPPTSPKDGEGPVLPPHNNPGHAESTVPLGKLKILSKTETTASFPKPVPHTPTTASMPAGKNAISTAYGVVHTHHVKYDSKTKTFTGLPPEWERQLSKQFGLDFNLLDRIAVEPYISKIPRILVLMKDYLFQHEGHKSEGIFRVAPDQDESVRVKQALDQGRFEGCKDINCMANLIKVWFREQPKHVLTGVDEDKIRDCDSLEKAGPIVNGLKEPILSLLLWLLDMCIEISSYSDVNKMTPQNLAIVIGPNLFAPSKADPMSSLHYSQKVANFLHQAIAWRQKQLSDRGDFLPFCSPTSPWAPPSSSTSSSASSSASSTS